MDAQQSHEGLVLLISLTAVVVIIFIAAFWLTFYRKADTSDNKH